jgi:hypothetical protein
MPQTPPPQQAPPPQQSAGPGEFTRMFAAPSQPMQTPKPAAAQPAATPTASRPLKKQSYVPLFIALGVLLIIAIAVIVIFALRK